MAQSIILKRSALPGKVPTTSSLNVGEVAINTYDGKVFIKSSGSIESIQTVITTNSTTTGSITLTKTGSFGEIIVSQDANIQRDLYVTNDIIGAGDIDISGNITGSSARLSGSLILTGSQTITNNLTVLGDVNARQFNISIISSSVLYESGSSKFGNTIDDTHQFTGSVDVSGSIILNGVALGGSSNSGSFTGSFSGDGSGLRGVVSDDLPIDGWDYDSNSSASISDFNVTSSKYLIDFDWDSQMGTPIGHKTFISNKSGSTQVVPTDSGVKFVVGNNIVATIDSNGIQATVPAGTVSGSSQLTSSYDSRYVLSGSITQTTWDNVASKPVGIVSGSSQLTSSILATTGSNTFRGNQTLSGSIIPAIDNTYDLGSSTYQWRDIYVSSGSLYIDGTKVLGSTGNELQITTDSGQSIKILEAGSDSIILQSADGDIQLKTSGGGNLLFDPTTGLIDVRGTLQIQDGYKITSSGGNSIQLGNDLGITGSISTTGNINGINLTTFSSSVDNRILTEKGRIDAILLASDADKDTFTEIVSLINSVDTTNDNAFATFYTASVGRLNNLESTSASVNTLNSLQTTRLDQLAADSGSQNTRITDLETKATTLASYTGSNDILNTLQTTRIDQLAASTASVNSFTSSINTTIKTKLDVENVISSSAQISGLSNAQLTNSAITIAGTSTSLGGTISAAAIGNAIGAFSGSSQVSLSGFSTSNLSEGSNLYYTDARVKTKLDVETVISGSSQVNANSITNFDANVLEYNNSLAVVSGSASSVKSFLSLGNVTNESKATMFTSPDFTGTPTAPTATSNTNSTQIATTAYVQQELTDLIGGAAAAFDTLIEISASLASGDSTLNTLVDGKLAKASNLADLTDTSAARTNLGLVIGTNVQAYNSTLATVAGGTYSGDDSITTVGTVTAGSVTAILPTGIISGSSQITMASTTGFGTYINQGVLTSSNPTFAGVKGSAYFDAQANSGFRIRNAADNANAGGWTRRGLWEGNANYDPALWAETGYGMYVYTNGSANIRSYWDTSGHFLPGSNATYNLGSSSNRWNTSYVSRLDINGSHPSGYGILNIVSSDSSVISLDSTTSNDVRIRYKTLGVDKWFGGMYTSDNWELRRGSDNGAMLSLTQSGNATLAGTFTENSSLRYKENVETIKYGLDKVLQMRGVTYNKKDNGVKEVGVIAEEVYDVLPEVVLKNEEGEIDSVSYGRIVGVLIEAIKEQQKQIEELKSLIK